MIKTDKVTSLALLIIVILAYSIMPIIPRIFSAYLTTYAYLGVVILTFFAILIIGKQEFLLGIFPIIIPLVMLNVIIYFSTRPEMMLWVYSLLLDVLAVAIGAYVIRFFDYKVIRVFVVVILIFLAITAITTIIGLNTNPDAARYLATVAESNEEEAVRYGFMNIGGYEFVYTVGLIYPAIIYGYKSKKIHFAVLIAYAVIDFILIINSGYTISLLLFIASTVFIFFKKELTVRNVVVIFIVVLLFSLLLFSLLSYLIDSLADVIDNKTISDRLHDLAGGREGLEKSEDNRLELYLTSITSFISHPIFGGIFKSVPTSGHSYILATLANYGIFGLIALIFIYSAIYTTFYKTHKNEAGYGYVFWTFMQAIILSVLNTGLWIYVLTLFLPIILTYINQKGVKDESSLDSKFFTA